MGGTSAPAPARTGKRLTYNLVLGNRLTQFKAGRAKLRDFWL